MAKNVSLLGANYPDVPAVQLPQTGGGTATFYDIQVVDNLNSSSAVDALSAKQGKILNDKIIEVKKMVVDAQTDNDGDINININTSIPLLSAVPDRDAGTGYFTSWYTVLLNGKRGGYSYYSAKILNDAGQIVANQRVKFTLYYIVVPYTITT